MPIINGRRIQVPPSGITGQSLIQQINPGSGRRPVVQQGLAFRSIQSGHTYKPTIINVIDLLFLEQSDYNQQSGAFLRIKKDFIHKALVELTSRYDVDTIIDVHTHPFSQASVSFSVTDNGDEKTFFLFLNEKFEGINYASIVFSQRRYSARVWTFKSGSIVARRALLKTQTSRENIVSSDFHEYTDEHYKKRLNGKPHLRRA